MAKGWSFDSLVKALKDCAFMNIGTTKGTVASGDDARIVGALQKKNNLSDVSDKVLSLNNINGFPKRGNLGGTSLRSLGGLGSIGFWSQANPKGTDLDYPANNVAGSLLIMPAGSSSTTHLFTTWDGADSWVRTYNGSSWSPWKRLLNGFNNLADLSNGRAGLDNLGGFHQRGRLDTTNLNDVKGRQFGAWRQVFDAMATSARNYPPSASAGSLLVYKNEANGVDGCTQVYYEYHNLKVWTRVFRQSSNTWSEWVKFSFASDNLSDLTNPELACRNLGIYQRIYPVGIVIFFDNTTNPNTTFSGTTWEEIKDGRAIRSATANGTVGLVGSDTFTLNDNNIPRHTHSITGTVAPNGNHVHWGGWNAPGDDVLPSEMLPNESWWDATVRLTGRVPDTSGTNNQGTHNRRRTTTAGSHSHTFSGSVSTAYNTPTSAVTHLGASRYYRVWKRVK